MTEDIWSTDLDKDGTQHAYVWRNLGGDDEGRLWRVLIKRGKDTPAMLEIAKPVDDKKYKLLMRYDVFEELSNMVRETMVLLERNF